METILKNRLLICLSVALIVVACSSKPENDSAEIPSISDTLFSTAVPLDSGSWNSHMSLSVPPTNALNESQSVLRAGKLITLTLENNSSETVIFQDDYGLQLLVFSTDQPGWVQITNNFRFVNMTGYPMLLMPSGIVNDRGGWIDEVSIVPDLQQVGLPTYLRVVIIGNIYMNETMSEVVGAFIDLTIK